MENPSVTAPSSLLIPVWLDRPLWKRLTPALLLVLVLMLVSAGLHFYNIQAIGDSNAYYTAAVKSMLQSWHNFFFVAAEPGGSVSVDKPPLGLWIQAAFAFVLGVSGFSVSLPNILAGIFGIPLLYHLVRKHLGSLAGLVAALVYTLTPTVIGTDRNSTMDGMLVFSLLLAAWAFLQAAEKGGLRWLLLGGVLVGLAFNIKMLQAFLPLPAFYALYFFGSREKWFRKLLNLFLATIVLLAVSLSWALAVDLTPADRRPYVGSSTDNTVTELIIGHNGLNRLLGRSGGGNAPQADRPDGMPPAGNLPQPQPGAANRPPQFAVQACTGLAPGADCTMQLPNGGTDHGSCARLQQVLACVPADVGQPQPGLQTGVQPGAGDASRTQFSPDAGTAFSNEIGSPSAVRLFIPPLAKEMSWLLPLALVSLFVLLAGARLRSRKDAGTVWPLEPAHRALALWGGWLVTCMVFFSVAEFFHDYYMIMLAAPLGAVIGGGVQVLWERREKLWTGLVLAFAALATLALQGWLAVQYGQDAWWLRLAAGLLAAGLVVLVAARLLRRRFVLAAAFSLLLAAVLVVPLAWSVLTVAEQNPDVNLPGAYGGSQQAGPGAYAGDLPAQPAANRSLADTQLIEFLQADTQDVEYLLAVPNANMGATLVLATGRPVLYMGGFSGSDPVVDAADLQRMVGNGELRYVLYGGDRSPQSGIASWLQSSCSTVPEFTRSAQGGAGTVLYLCSAGQ